MAATTNTAAQQVIDTVLRVAGQLTEDQMRRLAVERAAIDDRAFAAALFRAHAVAPAEVDAVDARLAVLVAAEEKRYAAWAGDKEARMAEVVREHPGAERAGLAGLWVSLLGTLVVGVLSMAGLAPWDAPLWVMVAGLALLMGASAVLGHHLTRATTSRAWLLDEAWRSVEGALLATAAAHTVGRRCGLSAAEYELLTRAWSARILPLPHITGT